jgi:hypothetical protein
MAVIPVRHHDGVKVFISSLITGYQVQRDAVGSAARSLRYEVSRAEDFGARPDTPQQACLSAVRESDVMVLLLGAAYGVPQASGLSATHEEWQEAVREHKPVLAFVERGVEREPAQERFLAEVQEWVGGRFRESFADPDELRDKVTTALHDFSVGAIVGPADEGEMRTRAESALPSSERGFGVRPSLALAVAPGPRRQLLRPTEIEDRSLGLRLQQEGQFGPNATLDPDVATRRHLDGSRLQIVQDDGAITVDEDGTITISQPVTATTRDRGAAMLPSIVEEEVSARLARALRFAGWLLDQIDPMQRVTDVVAVAVIANSGYMPWRTLAEVAANPHSGTMSMASSHEPVAPTPARRRRASLVHEADRIAEDLTALLRRGRR